MALLSAADQQKLREAFEAMTRSVRLLFFTQAIGCETCDQTKQILDELPALSSRIVVDEVNLVLDKDQAARYGIDRAPGIAVLSQNGDGGFVDSRIRFLGAPSGYEFVSLVRAVLLAGGGRSDLSEAARRRLADIDKPVAMQVFTTPT
jgi:alkyl hydroperoxide reductase subunit AhpF